MKQDFTDGAVAANLATNEAQYPAALLTGKQDSARSGKKITLFTYMLTQGGTDRVAAILAGGYADAGFDVEIVVLCGGGNAQPILSDLGGTAVTVRYLNGGSTWRTFDFIRLFPKLVSYLHSNAPDVLISTANNTAWICAAAMKMAGLSQASLILKTTNPIIGSRHRGIVRRLRLWGYDYVFSKAAAIWTLSQPETVLLQSAFPSSANRIRTVINPYVTKAMLAATTAIGEANASRLVLGVGRLTAQKRFDLLIQAFARIKHRDARLIILGDGEDRANLLELVAELGLSDRVSLPGFAKDVAEYYCKADLFVMTSRYEGLPAVILEAMAANCPVLSTDCFVAAHALLGSAEGCAIITKPDPAELAMMIDSRLADTRPTTLRAIAIGNSVEFGIADHVGALRDIG